MGYTLNEESVKYGDLIKNSRFRDKISFLINNPHLAEVELLKNFEPCCWGTTAYMLDANQQVKNIWVEKGHKLDDHCDAMGDFVLIPDNDKPGYIGRTPMELFLETLPRSNKEKDAVIAFFWQNKNNTEYCDFGLHHTGVYLGNDDGKDIFFEQGGIGERFRFFSIEDFIKDLSEESRKTLQIRFYSTFPITFL
jgi:hypothetical protein